MLNLAPSTDDNPRIASFAQYESAVRFYCRRFPAVFASAEGSYLYDDTGRRWLDFFSAAGALNYGHNHPVLKRALLRYIEDNGVVSSLDMYSVAKERFLSALHEVILQPRGLRYVCQCCGPTGANAVEAALKLARKVTGRTRVVAFSNSYHGMSDGALAISAATRGAGAEYYRSEPVMFVPYERFSGFDAAVESQWIRTMFTSKGSGLPKPAAFILELVQGEGGVNIASRQWVHDLFALSRELGALFIVDDIQAGCGRTGSFFSFESHGIQPDLVCVSKSISGLGLPMALLLIRPDLDVWSPGEHTGTFRGFGYSFVTAAAAINEFWSSASFIESLQRLGDRLESELAGLQKRLPGLVLSTRRKGLFGGVTVASPALAGHVQRKCFERGLVVELCGPNDEVLKLLPALTMTPDELGDGVRMIADAFHDASHDV